MNIPCSLLCKKLPFLSDYSVNTRPRWPWGPWRGFYRRAASLLDWMLSLSQLSLVQSFPNIFGKIYMNQKVFYWWKEFFFKSTSKRFFFFWGADPGICMSKMFVMFVVGVKCFAKHRIFFKLIITELALLGKFSHKCVSLSALLGAVVFSRPLIGLEVTWSVQGLLLVLFSNLKKYTHIYIHIYIYIYIWSGSWWSCQTSFR